MQLFCKKLILKWHHTASNYWKIYWYSCSLVFGTEKVTICDSGDMWLVAKKTNDVIQSKINGLQDGSNRLKIYVSVWHTRWYIEFNISFFFVTVNSIYLNDNNYMSRKPWHFLDIFMRHPSRKAKRNYRRMVWTR